MGPFRRFGAWIALLIGGCLALASACGHREAAPARNVLLIVIDTLRADQTSIHGYARDTTPWMAEWAKHDGQVFEWARSSAPWTKPSIASMLTGLDPQHHKLTLHLQKLPASGPNLAESFRSRGFQTAAIQSNHLLAHEFGYDRGFDTFVDDVDTTLATHDRSTGPAVNQATFDWLDGKGQHGRDPSRRFFLYVHHYEPHHNYLRDGSAYLPKYDGPLTGKESMDELYGLVSRMSAADVEFLRARYDAEIRYQDDLIRALVEGLRARGLLEDTAIVLTSDHGEEFKEHGDLSHQYKLYDELMHVPLVVVRPRDERAGRRIANPVDLTDLGRTLLDLCGQYATPFPGQSLVGLLEGAREPARVSVGHASTIPPGADSEREREMYVEGRFKLIRNLQPGTRELYDLTLDPREQHDLSRQQPAELERLEQAFEGWKTAHAALELGALPDNLQLSPELIERMHKLGYLGGGESKAESKPDGK